ncbi:hypothetical protein ACET3Z_018262 [Daucus carota]
MDSSITKTGELSDLDLQRKFVKVKYDEGVSFWKSYQCHHRVKVHFRVSSKKHTVSQVVIMNIDGELQFVTENYMMTLGLRIKDGI